MLKRILFVVIAAAALFSGWVATRPSEYRITRSVVVHAEPGSMYPLAAAFPKWDQWSPWAKLDPNMKVEYAGPEGGLGSTYSWKGNDKVGEGKMTVTGLSKDRIVDVKLDFLKPWEQTADVRIGFEPVADGTRVSWTMTGKYDFIGKLFAVFMDMDKAVGPDFERGLASLKSLGEKAQAAGR